MDLNIYEYMHGRYKQGRDILVSLKPVNKATGNVVVGLTISFKVYDEDRVEVVSEKTAVWNIITETYNYNLDVTTEWAAQALGTYFIAYEIDSVDLTPTIFYRIKILENIGAVTNITELTTHIGGGYTSGHIVKKIKPVVRVESVNISKDNKPKIVVKIVKLKE